jgi:hypothetical protein
MISVDEQRIIGMAGPAWISMLRAREERILNKIYGEFMNGKLDHTTSLAEFCCVRSQISEITNTIKQMKQPGGE